MSTPRRSIIRPTPAPAPARAARDLRLQKLRSGLATERLVLTRWMSRLRRAFHTVEKAQQRITRMERQIAQLEE